MTKRFIFSLVFPLASYPAISNLQKNIEDIHIPPSLLPSRKILQTVTWSDSDGKHLLILTQQLSQPVYHKNSDEEFKDADLFAFHYLDKQGEWVKQWKVQDGVSDCPLDVTSEFIPASLAITDMNNDGHAEVSFMYRTSCKGGLDPQTLKLIMYEGKSKFAIRGQTLIKVPNEPSYGGGMKIDSSFKAAPHEFLEFAIKQWNKYRTTPH
jgi:hypothetical protein